MLYIISLDVQNVSAVPFPPLTSTMPNQPLSEYHPAPLHPTPHDRPCAAPPYPDGKTRTNTHTHSRTRAADCLRIREFNQITRRRSTPASRRPRRAYITVTAGPSLAVCIDSLERYGVHRTDGADSAFT